MANPQPYPQEPTDEIRTLGPIRVERVGEPGDAPQVTMAQPPETVGAPAVPTDTVTGPDAIYPRPTSVPQPVSRTAVRTRRQAVPAAGMAVVGALTVLVGAWAGAVPFIGALFGYSADGSTSWTWSLSHTLLWLVPGGVAVATGLFMLLLVPRIGAGGGRATSVWAGILAAACGGWLVFGLSAWPALGEPGVSFGNGASATRLLLDQAGWTFGPGLVLVLLGGCALGLSLRRSAADVATTVPAGNVGGWTPVN